MIQFTNTLGGRKEPFRPVIPGEVGLYTCGPTVYDYAHIGNFRAYMFEDLLKRFLKYSGFKVRHVMNITDVDDKTIRGANAKGIGLRDYTAPFIQAFTEDLAGLRIEPADITPRATDHIPDMVRIIRGLLEKGIAYRKDGSIYFKIALFPGYGQLSKIDLSELRSTGRVESDEYEKENVQDFALWKAPKDGEPVWETEIGPGRPGWHIECSAMSARYLGQPFDIHCGGVDNIFPHHENEIAQSEALTGKPLANTWLHCHHLIVDGEKMSKSTGNFYTLRDLIRNHGVDLMALRFLLISSHYRKVLNFSFEALEQAGAGLRRIKDFLVEMETGSFPPGEAPETSRLLSETRVKFNEGLGDDLNISIALTALYELIRKVNSLNKDGILKSGDAQAVAAYVYSLDDVLGILPPRAEEKLPEALEAKIRAREAARKARDFASSDRIRKELAAAGVILEDTKDGVRWKIVKTPGAS